MKTIVYKRSAVNGNSSQRNSRPIGSGTGPSSKPIVIIISIDRSRLFLIHCCSSRIRLVVPLMPASSIPFGLVSAL